MRRSTGGRRRQRRPRGTRQTSWRNSTPVLVAKAIAHLIPENNASKWQTALSESSPARCFQVDREILAAAPPWDCVLSALYESRVIRPEATKGWLRELQHPVAVACETITWGMIWPPGTRFTIP